MLAGIYLNTGSFKEWSEERFNGVFSILQTIETEKLGAKLIHGVNRLNRFPIWECRNF